MHTFIKHTKKQLNAGLLKSERVEAFKKSMELMELMELMEENKHVNQYC